jgi:pimeloyl-ACP methyl ester carboxylesterase
LISKFAAGKSDLEAIRQTLGAEKMILIGHFWGSTLAASYMGETSRPRCKGYLPLGSRRY